MASMFLRLPFDVARTDLPVLNSADITTIAPEVEADSYAHWILSGATPLTSLNAVSKLLTQQGGATAPTLNSDSVTLPLVAGSQLESDLADTGNFTLCGVFKTNSTTAFAGTASSTGTAGVNLFITGGGGYVTIRNASGTPINSLTPAAAATSTYAFWALSVDAVNLKATLTIAKDGVVSTIDKVYTPAYSGSTKTLAIGNSQIADIGAVNTVTTAEFILYDKALSAAQHAQVYERTRKRMSLRGITV